MARCRACGGILGLDCYNESDCMQISYSNEQYYSEQDNKPLYDELQNNHYAILEYEKKIEILKDVLNKHNIKIPDLSTGSLYYYDFEKH